MPRARILELRSTRAPILSDWSLHEAEQSPAPTPDNLLRVMTKGSQVISVPINNILQPRPDIVTPVVEIEAPKMKSDVAPLAVDRPWLPAHRPRDSMTDRIAIVAR